MRPVLTHHISATSELPENSLKWNVAPVSGCLGPLGQLLRSGSGAVGPQHTLACHTLNARFVFAGQPPVMSFVMEAAGMVNTWLLTLSVVWLGDPVPM